MKKLIFVALLIAAVTACKNNNADSALKPKITDAVMLPPPRHNAPADPNADINIDGPVGNSDDKEVDENNNSAPEVTDTSTKIVKDGSIQFETNDLAGTRKKILNWLKKYGGYADEDNESTSDDEGQKQYELKIRVPAKNFDFFVNDVSSTAYKIDSKNISVTDVTAQYIDIKTRLDNKKILEKRYLDLLNKSSKISDLLEIENKLTEIRSDIESTQGQLNYLSRQVAYSSLDITFYTKQSTQVDTGDGIGYKFKTAIGNGWDLLQNLFFDLIGIWPIIIGCFIVYWLFKTWRKRRRIRKAS